MLKPHHFYSFFYSDFKYANRFIISNSIQKIIKKKFFKKLLSYQISAPFLEIFIFDYNLINIIDFSAIKNIIQLYLSKKSNWKIFFFNFKLFHAYELKILVLKCLFSLKSMLKPHHFYAFFDRDSESANQFTLSISVK